jgi:hypothetical protein
VSDRHAYIPPPARGVDHSTAGRGEPLIQLSYVHGALQKNLRYGGWLLGNESTNDPHESGWVGNEAHGKFHLGSASLVCLEINAHFAERGPCIRAPDLAQASFL